MARKRLIAPQFFQHGGLYDAEVGSGMPLRLAFAGLWGQADRRGVFQWRPRELKLAILPYDNVDMAAALEALRVAQFIFSYEVGGKLYGFIPSMKAWQTFHRDEKPSKDPAPPADLLAVSSFATLDAPPDEAADSQQQDIFGDPAETPGQHDAGTVSALCEHSARTPIAVAVAVPIANAVTKTRTDDALPSSSSSSVLTHTEQQQPASPSPATSLSEQERQLFALASPEERLAFDVLFGPLESYRPAAVAMVCAIAARQENHRVVGRHRVAGPADVLRAAAQMAANGQAWNADLYRGYVKRLCNRPEQDAQADTEQRARRVVDVATQRNIPVPPPETEEQRAARRAASEQAMEAWRAQYHSASGPLAGAVAGAVKALVA